MKIERDYYTLAEVHARWGLPRPELIYLAENGKLSLSVRVFGVPVEIGSIEEVPEGDWFQIPHTQTRFSGVLDLHPAHVFHVFRDGRALVTHFIAADGDYANILPDCEPVEVRRSDLLVRREERKRVEAELGFSRRPRSRKASRPTSVAASARITSDFHPSADYREVRVGDELYHFGAIQAEVIRALHAAHRAGATWQSGKVILTAAGSKCLRMADIFKSNPAWGRLVVSNQRGLYCLAIAESRRSGRRRGRGSPGDTELPGGGL